MQVTVCDNCQERSKYRVSLTDTTVLGGPIIAADVCSVACAQGLIQDNWPRPGEVIEYGR